MAIPLRSKVKIGTLAYACPVGVRRRCFFGSRRSSVVETIMPELTTVEINGQKVVRSRRSRLTLLQTMISREQSFSE